MKFRLTAVAMALSVFVIGPVYADGSGGCEYGSKWRYTSVEPQEESEASKKLASLNIPITEEETAGQATPSERIGESAPQAAEESTTK
jgi:hypothetical protein